MRLRPHIAVVAVAAAVLSWSGIAPAQAQPRVSSTAGAYLAARAASIRLDLVSAAQFYRQVFNRDPAYVGLSSTILSLWVEAGVVRDAAPIAENIISSDPSNEPARFVLASEAIKNGDFDAAEMHLDAIGGDSFSDLVTGLVGAWVKVGQGAAGEAEEALAELPRAGLLGAFHAALIADFDGRPEDAIALIEPIYAPDAATQRLAEAYARFLARAGMTSEAESAIRDFVELAPDQPMLSLLLADIRAGEEIGPMIATAEQGTAEVFYGLASSLLSGEDFDTAIAYLQLSRFIGGGSDLPSILLGQIFQSQNRFDEAARVFDSIERDSPFAITAVVGASVSDNNLGRDDSAVARLAPVVAANPTDKTAADALAGIYRNISQFEAANSVLDAVISSLDAVTSADWRLFFARGITFERIGQWPQAEADFFRALSLAPDQPDVLNYLGYSWLDRDVNFLEALEMIERAVDQRPGSGYIVDSLGWAYYKLGDYDAASETLELATEMSPGEPEVLEHLGDAYWRAGRETEAVFQWSHALGFEPAPDVAERIQSKIESGLPDVKDDGVREIN